MATSRPSLSFPSCQLEMKVGVIELDGTPIESTVLIERTVSVMLTYHSRQSRSLHLQVLLNGQIFLLRLQDPYRRRLATTQL